MSARNRETGSTLIVVLAMAAVFAAMTLSSTMRIRDLLRDGTRDEAMLAAVHAADGALDAARVALARDADWSGGDVAIGRLTARVEVARVLSTDGQETDRCLVVTHVEGRGVVKRVEAVLRLREGRLPVLERWSE